MKDSVSEIIGCITRYMQKDTTNISSPCLSEFAAKFTKQMTKKFYDINVYNRCCAYISLKTQLDDLVIIGRVCVLSMLLLIYYKNRNKKCIIKKTMKCFMQWIQ